MPEDERNLEHQRAAYAFKCIQQIKDIPALKKNYLSRVRNAGPLIYKSGLMQTLTFYCSKGDDYFVKLTLHILKWILDMNRLNPVWNENQGQTNSIVLGILNSSDEKIMALTEETKALLVWLKRFADAELKD